MERTISNSMQPDILNIGWLDDDIKSVKPMTSFRPASQVIPAPPEIIANFEESFWSAQSFERLKRYLKQNGEFIKKITELLNDRAAVEAKFAKDISAIGQKFKKCSAEYFGCTSHAFRVLAEDMELEAEGRKAVANTIVEEMIKPMKEVITAQIKQRRIADATVTKSMKVLAARRQDDFKNRARLFQLCLSLEDLSTKYTHNQAVSVPTTALVEDDNSEANSSITSNAKHLADIKQVGKEIGDLEEKYLQSTMASEFARQDRDMTVLKSMRSVEAMEREKLELLGNVIAKFVALYSAISTQNKKTSDTLSSLESPVNSDIKEICHRYGDCSLQQPELMIFDLPAEDARYPMDRTRREEMLSRWLNRTDENIAKYEKSLEGLDNLASFKHDYQQFNMPSDDINLKRCNVMLLRALFEASQHKFQKSLRTFKPNVLINQAADTQWFLIHTSEKGMPLTFVRLPVSFSLLRLIAQSKAGWQITSNQKGWQNGLLRTGLRHSLPKPPKPELMVQLPMGRTNSAANDNNGAPYVSNGGNVHISSPYHPNSQSVGSRCVAQFHYQARRPDELTIAPGDIILVLETRPDKWWRGQLRKTVGLFPSTYVQKLPN